MKKFSVTRNGKELDKSLYNWDESTKTFSTKESNLVLDFSDWCGCTFTTWSDCVFTTGSNCIVIRRDIYEVIELKENQNIKLNGYKVKGFNVNVIEEKHIIVMDGKEIELSKDSYQALKKSLN